MANLRRFLRRLVTFLRSHRAEQELEREVAAHLALLEDEYRRRGMSEEEARRAARLALGGVDQTKERHRDERSFGWLEDARRDVPYALRALARNPAFTGAAIVTVALGVGAATAMFSVINAVLLRPLPYVDSDRLVRVGENVTMPSPTGPRPGRRFAITQDEFLEWRERTKTLAFIAGVNTNPFSSMTTSDDDVRVISTRVSPALFEMLGVPALLGRTLLLDDERPDSNTAVISAAAWQRFFGSDPSVLGRQIVVNRTAFSIVGVMPPDFDFPSRDIQLWLPLAPRPGQGRAIIGQMLAKMANGVSLDDATVEANAIGAEVRRDAAGPGPGVPPPPPPPSGATLGGPANLVSSQMGTMPRFQVFSVKEMLVAPVRRTLTLLAAAVAVVLVIVCANVANLLLARGTARQREIGVRLALGASRGRIVRQVLTESTVLSVVGSIGGAVMAALLVRLVRTLAVVDTPPLFQISTNLENGSMLPRIQELSVDVTTLAFALALSIVTGIVFGVMPALFLSRLQYSRAISASASSRTTASQARTRMRHALVVTQLTLAMTLLVGAGLLVHSFVKLIYVETGYDARNVVNFQLIFPQGATVARRMALIEEFIARLRAAPDVAGAGFTNVAPFLALTETVGVFVPPGSSRDEMLSDPLRPQTRSVTHTYLQTLGVRLLDGRWLNERDGAGQPLVMLVNSSLARRYFGRQSPVGTVVQLFRTTENVETWQIVGVVDDVKQARVDQEYFPIIYMDTRQLLPRTEQGPQPFGVPSIAVRASSDVNHVIAEARMILRQLDPAAALDGIATLEQLKYGSLVRPRFYAILTGLLAAIAGIIAAVGVYGVLAFTVVQRTQEIGIRMALGAERGAVLRFVLRQGLVLAAAGIATGIGGALALTRYLEGMLFGVTPLDIPTYTLIAMLFASVAALASYVPARRATKVDPVVALRCE